MTDQFRVTSCANHNTGARADGVTQHGTGTAGGNLAGLPIGSPLNQCGGADLFIPDIPVNLNL
ncbi:chaplin family protein [Streptomyces sp. NPDC085931]|uniref:chaplin family protein n=1 Tax=Streptomyces sp. NPDC085931 TaxID=3365740 RepID=UPI0037D71D5A